MKMLKLLLCAGLALCLCGCGAPLRESSFFSMDTYIQLRADCDEAAATAVREEIERLSSLLDCHDEHSALSVANSSGAVDSQLAEIVEGALAAARETDGCFNPALFDVKQLWSIGEPMERLPTKEQIAAALQSADYTAVSAGQLGGARLDLGGYAKGYASDSAIALLREAGVSNAILSLGGSVALLGDKDGGGFTVAIQDPRGEVGDTLGELQLADCFIATSGDYQRYSELDGVRYHHIFGKDGRPADSDIISVSVIAASGAVADAYSTALFVMGSEGAAAFLEQHADIDAIIVTNERRVILTERLHGRFTLTGEGYSYED